jgi:segregation and condensation protein B
MFNKGAIGSLMYLQGEEGLTPKQLSSATKISLPKARKALKIFLNEFNQLTVGIQVVEFNDIFKFATIKENKEIIENFATIEKKQKLSKSAIETVGIVAYKQPVTKSQVNTIRGMSSDGVFQTLLKKGLVKEVGIAQTPGSPILYGITNKFYDYFQIKSLKELPKLQELSNEETSFEEEFDLYSSQRET